MPTKSAFTSMTVGGLVIMALPVIFKTLGFEWHEEYNEKVYGLLDDGATLLGFIIAYIGRQRAAISGIKLHVLPQ